MRVNEAQLILNPDHRFDPQVTNGRTFRCGYVQVYAVAPGCFPVEAGALSTVYYRGEIRYQGAGGKRLRLEEALAELRERLPNYDLTPMAPEIITVIGMAKAGG